MIAFATSGGNDPPFSVTLFVDYVCLTDSLQADYPVLGRGRERRNREGDTWVSKPRTSFASFINPPALQSKKPYSKH